MKLCFNESAYLAAAALVIVPVGEEIFCTEFYLLKRSEEKVKEIKKPERVRIRRAVVSV